MEKERRNNVEVGKKHKELSENNEKMSSARGGAQAMRSTPPRIVRSSSITLNPERASPRIIMHSAVLALVLPSKKLPSIDASTRGVKSGVVTPSGIDQGADGCAVRTNLRSVATSTLVVTVSITVGLELRVGKPEYSTIRRYIVRAPQAEEAIVIMLKKSTRVGTLYLVPGVCHRWTSV